MEKKHSKILIDAGLMEKMERMVGFRNIAVRNYEEINPAILKRIVQDHLKDIEEFYVIIYKLCSKQ